MCCASGTTTVNVDINNTTGNPFRIETRDSGTTSTVLMNGEISGSGGLYAIWVNATTGNTISLAGVNTFTGGLTVDFTGGGTSGGIFEVAAGGSIMAGNPISIITDPVNTGPNEFHLNDGGTIHFNVSSTGVSDSIISGGGVETKSVLLDGDFVFDLTGAATVVSSFWDMVDVSNLAVVFGNTFSLSSTLGAFAEVGDTGVWMINENGVTYEFSEDTGRMEVLAMVPEPSAYALTAGALALICVMIRRRSN